MKSAVSTIVLQKPAASEAVANRRDTVRFNMGYQFKGHGARNEQQY